MSSDYDKFGHKYGSKFDNVSDNCSKCIGSNFNLSTLDPAYQYQIQKVIQNTVRVPSSLYSMNLGALASYQPASLPTRVNWNQMSDRAVPHIQTDSAASLGSFYHGSSTKRSQTRERPGATTPGGSGVDIKHNSYNRYLNRLKGGKLLRRGVIPPTYGAPIPFIRGFPVYGGKTVKTAIVSNCPRCICPSPSPSKTTLCDNKTDNERIYRVVSQKIPFDARIIFKVGDIVYARKKLVDKFSKATILSNYGSDIYSVEFEDGSIDSLSSTLGQIISYFPCDCNTLGNRVDNLNQLINGKYLSLCRAINTATGPDYLNLVQKYGSLLSQYDNSPVINNTVESFNEANNISNIAI